jgi:site-specific DNA recombinase
MRVALYARVSTDRQVEKFGIPSQIEALRKRCREKNLIPLFDEDSGAFIDDGYSGAELDKPALNRLRQAEMGRGIQGVRFFCLGK